METTLVKIDEFKSLITSAPAVLEENRTSYGNALKKGEELICLAKEKMDDLIDEQLSVYVSRVKTTAKTMKEKREPFTQIMTMIAKEFTTLESGLKTPIDECQSLRDAYATKKAEERKERERLASLKLAKDNELINALSEYKIKYAEESANFLLRIKQKELDWLNALTLEKIGTAELSIALVGSDVLDLRNLSVSNIPLNYSSQDEFFEFSKAERELLYESSFTKFRQEIQSFKRELLDLLPSKKNQLIEAKKEEERAKKEAEAEAERKHIAEAEAEELRKKIAAENNEKEKARLEEEARQAKLKAEREEQERKEAERKREAEAERVRLEEEARQAEEKARLEEEARQAKLKAEADANVAAAEQRASSFVDSQANLFQESGKVKEGYSIEVKNNAGYLLIIQFWFEKEGKNLTPDKIEKMSIERMKTFCEKHAIKENEFIQSGLIEYKTIYKAK